MFCDGEESVGRNDFGMCCQIVAQFLAKEARHDNVALRGSRLGWADNVLALDAGIGAADADDVEPEVDVLRTKGKELALAATRQIERQESEEMRGLSSMAWEKSLNSVGVQ